MNKEEIEELKDFTIDLTDIDELALGLEVCSKKSNMVIQEFADTIIQLQQENQKYKEEKQELKKQLEELKKQLEEFRLDIINGEPYIKLKTVTNQQKEFIKFLEDNYKEIQDIWYIKILQKYKEIIGGKE